MDIYKVLKNDHKEFKALLKKLDETSERSVKERPELVEKLKMTLVPHARAEEKIFYIPLKKSDVKEADDLAFEGHEEHGVVDRLFDELAKTKPNDKRYGALLSVLKESLEHHIKEEEGDMFKKAKKSFGKAKLIKDMKAGKKLKQPPSHSIK
jgi:hemerythrin superfamily protein